MQPSHDSTTEEEWLPPGEAAKLLGVTVETIRRWADAKLIPYRQITPGRHRRFRRADLLAAMDRDRRAERAS